MMGQAEADAAADRVREQERLRAQAAKADLMDYVDLHNAGGVGGNVPPPTPDKGTLSE